MIKKTTIADMLKAGVHFGHQKAKYQPKMKPYVYTVRNNIHILDLEQTAEKLAQAQEFATKIIQNNGTILFIGTKRQTKNMLKKTAQECEMPYVSERWLGGTFTNFKIISNLIQKLCDLEEQEESGELKKYTKKEHHEIKQEIKRLNKLIGGIKTLKKLPDAVFVADTEHDKTAIKESSEKNIPIIAITDTNSDPSKIKYPIPANDDAIPSIKLILEQIQNAIKK